MYNDWNPCITYFSMPPYYLQQNKVPQSHFELKGMSFEGKGELKNTKEHHNTLPSPLCIQVHQSLMQECKRGVT